MAIIVIHGIATGGGGVYRMGEELARQGYKVKFYRYEKRHFWSYWNMNNMRQDGSSLLHDVVYTPGDDVLCHSNGQLVMQSAVAQGAKFGSVAVFSGAGTSDKFVYPAGSVNEVHWFVNVQDKAVWLGSKLWRHPFGKAARVGYAGVPDDRQINHKYNYSEWFSIEHSFWFGKWMKPMINILVNWPVFEK